MIITPDSLIQKMAQTPFLPNIASGIEGVGRISNIGDSYLMRLFFVATLTLIYCLIGTQLLYFLKHNQTQNGSTSPYYYITIAFLTVIGLIQLTVSLWLTIDPHPLSEIFDHTDQLSAIGLYVIGYVVVRNGIDLLIAPLYLKTSLILSGIFLRLQSLLIASLLLYPILLVNFYRYPLSQNTLVWILISLYLLMTIYHTIRSSIQISPRNHQLLYIILYLCTLDFLPLVIMLKAIALD